MGKMKNAKRWLVIALILCLISSAGAALVQTNFGKVTVKDLRWETESGHMMSALLFIPKNATAENPAPGIVASHGWYNNREMQDLNFVEYARRGYVVMSIDMYGHGNSDVIQQGSWFETNANGMYDAVKLMSTLPYVQPGVGVTGHSNGALASRIAIAVDSAQETPLIAAGLFVSNDATYKDKDENFVNAYGSRDIGIVACQYDEFFHRVTQEDGSKSPPREFMNQVTAQSFLNFGEDPAGADKKEASTFYEKEIDGENATRVIYNPNQIHPWAHFSKVVVADSVEFFEKVLPSPNPIAGNNQIWQIKTAFNFLGLIGFVLFLVNFTLVLVDTKVFSDLKAETDVLPRPRPTGKKKSTFIITQVLSIVFSIVSYNYGYYLISLIMPKSTPQQPVFFIGMWSLLCGLFTLLLTFLTTRGENKVDLEEIGVKIGGKKLLKTILLGVLVAVSAYSLVFLSDFFFKTDYRIWVIALKAFTPKMLPYILMFLPLFLAFYVMNSVSINSYNYFGEDGKDNTVLVAILNGLSPAITIAFCYIFFRVTGVQPIEKIPFFGSSITGIWQFPVVIILPVAAVISRIIYKKTKNPYIAGIIMAIVITTMSATNTLTHFG